MSAEQAQAERKRLQEAGERLDREVQETVDELDKEVDGWLDESS